MKGSDLVAQFLEEKGIRHVFGIIGAGNVHIFDSIARRGFTEVICVHHEQAAVMAMGTYFRMTNQVTASILTTGAGSTNGVTGVVSCWMDSVPGIIISGNENSKFTSTANPLRIWGVQGYDSSAMVSGVTKYSNRVSEPTQIYSELEKAYWIAREGRPGPCWLDIPMNLQSSSVNSAQLEQFVEPKPRKSLEELESLTNSVDRVMEGFLRSQRPLLWLGHGIRLAGAERIIPGLLETLGIPALVSWAGIDMVDAEHPLVVGRAGIYGQRAANFALQNCDYLLTIGTRLAIPQVGYEWSEFARAAEIAVVDIDPKELYKLPERVQERICADAGDFMRVLLERARATRPTPPTLLTRSTYEPWIKRCHEWQRTYPTVGPEHADQDGYMNSYAFMKRLEKTFKPDQVVVTDMGTALLSGHQVLNLRPPKRLMTSTGLGEMGYGLPAAIGASFARNRGEVLCLNCDGGMMMNLQELQTIVHHQLPIKIIVFNNDGYLMIKHTQKALFKGEKYTGTDRASGISCPNYSKIAAGFGIPAFQIERWADFDDVMAKVQEAKGPVLCEVSMHPEQPFVPKLALAAKSDGTYVSPPLEDLSPLLPRSELKQQMQIGVHPKSESL